MKLQGICRLGKAEDNHAEILTLEPFADKYAVLAIAFGMLAWFEVTREELAKILYSTGDSK